MKKMIQKMASGWFLKTGMAALLGLVFTVGGFAQTPPTAVRSLPQNSNIFSPNGTGWVLTARGTYTYDSLGRETASSRTALSSQQLTSRDSVRYDAAGNVIYRVTYVWNGNAWNLVIGTKTQIVYNAAGKKTEETSQTWNAGAWENDIRKVTTYNTSNYPNVITTFLWRNNAWAQRYRFVYTYTSANNPPTEQVYQQYVNGTWENVGKMANLLWHDFDSFALLSFISYSWGNNAWNISSQGTTVYDAFGGYVTNDQTWNNGSWQPSMRQSVYYDANLNFTGRKTEQFQNNAWVTLDEMRFLLTYNAAGQITERIYRSWNGNTNTLVNNEKTVYSNFLLLSTQEDRSETSGPEVTVFPNPATDFIRIQKAGNEAATATLTDLRGRVVLLQQLQATSLQKVDLRGLPNGVYLLKLESSKGLYIRKVVKR